MSADTDRLAETVRYWLKRAGKTEGYTVPVETLDGPFGTPVVDPLAPRTPFVEYAAAAALAALDGLVLEHTRQEEALRAYEAAVQEGLLVAPNHWHQYRDPFELDPAIRQARALVRALSPPPVASGGERT